MDHAAVPPPRDDLAAEDTAINRMTQHARRPAQPGVVFFSLLFQRRHAVRRVQSASGYWPLPEASTLTPNEAAPPACPCA